MIGAEYTSHVCAYIRNRNEVQEKVCTSTTSHQAWSLNFFNINSSENVYLEIPGDDMLWVDSISVYEDTVDVERKYSITDNHGWCEHWVDNSADLEEDDDAAVHEHWELWLKEEFCKARLKLSPNGKIYAYHYNGAVAETARRRSEEQTVNWEFLELIPSDQWTQVGHTAAHAASSILQALQAKIESSSTSTAASLNGYGR